VWNKQEKIALYIGVGGMIILIVGTIVLVSY